MAPIGRAFLSTRGLRVAVAEIVILSPVLAYVLWPRGALSATDRRR